MQMPPRQRQKRGVGPTSSYNGSPSSVATTVEPFTYGRLLNSSSVALDQFAEQFLGMTFGIHLGNCRQMRGASRRPDESCSRCRSATFGVFPMLGEFTNFHDDYLAPADGRPG